MRRPRRVSHCPSGDHSRPLTVTSSWYTRLGLVPSTSHSTSAIRSALGVRSLTTRVRPSRDTAGQPLACTSSKPGFATVPCNCRPGVLE